MKTILITGGSGLIGNHLTQLLRQEGYGVIHLSRKKRSSNVTTYEWNPDAGEIDDAAIVNADYIIHLAGANVAEHRWTKKYKAEILRSRTQSAALMYAALERTPNKVQAIISASAIGYYGDRGDEWLQEDAPPANDFLATTCLQWEAAVNKISALNKRVVILRTGIVLSKDGGALPPLVQPIRFGIAPIFGNGEQYYPWIHIDDLSRMYLHAINNETMRGAYNAVAPTPERFYALMNTIAKVMHRKKLNIPLPMFALEMVLGEFVKSLAMSTRCSADKMVGSGFEFRYRELEAALAALIGK
ncbi:MAG: TIGR01777 family oxidoreductase [Chitinophagales bacterium]